MLKHNQKINNILYIGTKLFLFLTEKNVILNVSHIYKNIYAEYARLKNWSSEINISTSVEDLILYSFMESVFDTAIVTQTVDLPVGMNFRWKLSFGLYGFLKSKPNPNKSASGMGMVTVGVQAKPAFYEPRNV